MDHQEALRGVIIERGLLKAAQLDKVQRRAEKEGKKLEDIIREEKLLYPEPLAQVKAEALGVPYIDLSEATIDPAAMEGVSVKAASTYQFVTFNIANNQLQVAMASPEDYQAQEAIRFVAAQRGLKADIYCASPEAITKAIGQEPGDARQALKDFGREFKQAVDLPREGDKLRTVLVKAPITKIVAVIIRHAIDGDATDIHIEPGAKQIRVRYRIAGQLHTTLLLPADMLPTIAARLRVLAGMPLEGGDVPQEGRFTVTDDNDSYRVHLITMPTINGERITLGLVGTAATPPSLNELGLSEEQQELLRENIHAEGGLILFAGSEQSGVGTTLAAALWEVNAPNNAVATIEDTIELEVPGVSQTQVQARQGLTYNVALTSALRQDFDVIMIEQLLDGQVADLALQGAQAGKLILAATAAPDVAHAIEQLTRAKVHTYVLSLALLLVVAQRLLPQLCQACKEAVPIPRDLRVEISAEMKRLPKTYLKSQSLPEELSFFESQGCKECHDTKVAGTVALFEIVPMFGALREAITTGADAPTLETIIRAKGFPSLRQDGIIKAFQGKVRYADVVHATAQMVY